MFLCFYKYIYREFVYNHIVCIQIFGLLAEKDGVLIINNYSDLIGDNKRYRTVKFYDFDRWSPNEKEIKSNEYKKYFSNKNSIKIKGVCTKNEKTIGIRLKYCWLQLTFRYKWEFDKFLKDSNCYAFCDEYDRSIVTKYKDLKQSDYRLLNVSTNDWDKFNDAEVDGTIAYTVDTSKKKGWF